MDLTQMRARLRRDLHDEDAASYRWTDAELDRHLDRALRELSQAVPLEARASLTTSASRELSLASLTGLIAVAAVEYPAGKYPPIYVRFSRWESTLTLLVDQLPVAGEQVNVYYGKLHTLDGATSTIPVHLEDVVATGAAGYAALEWASFATNRVNVGGEAAGPNYLVWGRELLGAFRHRLSRERSRLRRHQLYQPAEPAASQTTDWGP
ncbi:MAG: hypothetical protein HYY01_01240 [Chloroflexi bacterium]|nr:hypothetical protein [Chloroflexota bacterium]